MKRPLQALLIAPDKEMRRRIIDGSKAISIREGYRAYTCGPVLLGCHLEPWAVLADIVSVRHCTLKEVSAQECVDDGCIDLFGLWEALRRYYPHIQESSLVTVIRWKHVRGALVDDLPHLS